MKHAVPKLLLCALMCAAALPACTSTQSDKPPIEKVLNTAEQALNEGVALGLVKSADADKISLALTAVESFDLSSVAFLKVENARKVAGALAQTGALTPQQALAVNAALALYDTLKAANAPPAKAG